MGNYSFDETSAYIFQDQLILELDDVIEVIKQDSQNPFPVWENCFVVSFYNEEQSIQAQFLSDSGRMFSVPLYSVHQLLINDTIAIKTNVSSNSKLSVVRE